MGRFSERQGRRSLKAFNEAFAEVHRRLPLDSPGDGRMLAGVQETMAHLTASWWCSQGSKTGAPEAALLAAGSLLTVFYEGSIPDAANPRKINLMSFAVPASGSTKRSFTTGFAILSAAMPRLSIRGQLRALESLRSVAHPALGFAGPFGLEVSEETRTMINDFFEAAVIPWLSYAMGEMPLPVAAAAMELVEWRAHFGEPPPVQIEVGQQLRDYRELFEPGGGWGSPEDDPDELGYQRVVADRHARRLVEDSDPQPRLARWAEWYELRILATGGKPHGPMLGMIFQRVVELDRTRGVEVIELLVAAESPLLGHAAVAIGNVLMTIRVMRMLGSSRGQLTLAPRSHGRLSSLRTKTGDARFWRHLPGTPRGRSAKRLRWHCATAAHLRIGSSIWLS